MSDRVKVGVIGCGARLRQLAGMLIRQFPQIEIAALSDPSDESIRRMREEVCPHAVVFEDYRDLCAVPGLSWVMVGSWNNYHREHVVSALESGKHVFCEKPLATTVDDCLAIRESHRRSGRIFFFGLVLRYADFYIKIKELLDAGYIGKLISFEFNETLEFNHGGYIHQDWRRLTEYSGGHLLEKCCHDVDLVNWFVGSLPRRVASFGGRDFFNPPNKYHEDRIGPNPHNGKAAYHGWESPECPFTLEKDIVDNQVAILEFENGVRGTFHTNCQSALIERRMYLLGTEGTLKGDLFAGVLECRRIGWETPVEVYKLHGGGHGNGDGVLIKHLAGSILTGDEPLTPIDDGITSTVVSLGIDHAMATGKVVDLSDQWRKVGVELAKQEQKEVPV